MAGNGSGLENRRALKCLEGSIPSSSANTYKSVNGFVRVGVVAHPEVQDFGR